MLTETCDLLKYEPEVLPEGKIVKMAKKNLREIDVIITKLCETSQNFASL